MAKQPDLFDDYTPVMAGTPDEAAQSFASSQADPLAPGDKVEVEGEGEWTVRGPGGELERKDNPHKAECDCPICREHGIDLTEVEPGAWQPSTEQRNFLAAYPAGEAEATDNIGRVKLLGAYADHNDRLRVVMKTRGRRGRQALNLTPEGHPIRSGVSTTLKAGKWEDDVTRTVKRLWGKNEGRKDNPMAKPPWTTDRKQLKAWIDKTPWRDVAAFFAHQFDAMAELYRPGGPGGLSGASQEQMVAALLKGGWGKGREKNPAAPPDTKVKAPLRKDFGDRVAQSLSFPKSKFTAQQAVDWADEHGTRPIKGDPGDDFYHLRLVDPTKMREDSYKTLTLDNGVQVRYGDLKRKGNPVGVVPIAQLVSAVASAAGALGAVL